MRRFLVEFRISYTEGSALAIARTLDVFLRWLKARHRGRGQRLTPDILSKALLAAWYADLAGDGQHGRPRMLSTRKRMVQRVQAVWAWAAKEEDFAEFVPRPINMKMESSSTDPTVAPTWDEMDRCIAAAGGATRKLAIVLRCTGLRVQQAMRLLWSDVDLERGKLQIRGALGKTRQEKRGRLIPLSPHLVEELQRWKREGPWLVPSARAGKSERIARQRDMLRAWKRSGVREVVWRGDSHHSFRNGFVSGLKRLRADDEAVEYLVGHSLGLRGAYTDPEALPLDDTVGRIPPIGGREEPSVRLSLIPPEEGALREVVCPQSVPARRCRA